MTAAAHRLPGVDPARIALWGTSYAGGHVVPVAVRDAGVAAIVSLTPTTDGLASLLHVVRHAGAGRLMVSLAGRGLRDLALALPKRPPHLLPIVGLPGRSRR